MELQLQHHCGGRKISERAVGERDSQGKHGEKFGRWMAIKKEGRKKISLFAKLVISVFASIEVFVDELRKVAGADC